MGPGGQLSPTSTHMSASKKKVVRRLFVGSPGGPRSGVWQLVSKKGHLYVISGGMGGIQKISFHTQLICRQAFTKEYGTPPSLTNRALIEWRRAENACARVWPSILRADGRLPDQLSLDCSGTRLEAGDLDSRSTNWDENGH
jgi:hypothetical protein